MTDAIPLDPRRSALVLIDLQDGILAAPLAPLSGEDLLAAGQGLAERFRAAGAVVVLVRVGWSAGYADAPPGLTDRPTVRPPEERREDWSRLAPGLQRPGDLVVVKRQWGAFHGTELDLQLRRRGIDTVVVGGVATNFGVESTVRAAWELGYGVIVAEDICTSFDAAMHAFPMSAVFPRIARVTSAPALRFEASQGA